MMVFLKFLFGIKKFIAFFLALFFIASFSGCSKQGKGFFATILGASAGSAIGAALSKDKKKGAMIGAVVGGVAGTAASIALGGGIISIAFGAISTLGATLVNYFAYRKNKKRKKAAERAAATLAANAKISKESAQKESAKAENTTGNLATSNAFAGSTTNTAVCVNEK